MLVEYRYISHFFCAEGANLCVCPFFHIAYLRHAVEVVERFFYQHFVPLGQDKQ
jgi:hypothetical protein